MGKGNIASILIVVALLLLISSILILSGIFKTDEKSEGPVCGDNTCELGETSEECCMDCGCLGKTEICNTNKNQCDVEISKLTEEEARRIIEDFYIAEFEKGNIDFEITNIEDIEDFNYNNLLGKRALVTGLHHSEDFEPFGDFNTVWVSDQGEVFIIEHA